MTQSSLLDDLQRHLNELIQNTPAADIQRNLRALLEQTFRRFDLVSRDELDTYVQWAAGMRERITQLEERIEALERRDRTSPPASDSAASLRP